jgi:hypothetical protein
MMVLALLLLVLVLALLLAQLVEGRRQRRGCDGFERVKTVRSR